MSIDQATGKVEIDQSEAARREFARHVNDNVYANIDGFKPDSIVVNTNNATWNEDAEKEGEKTDVESPHLYSKEEKSQIIEKLMEMPSITPNAVDNENTNGQSQTEFEKQRVLFNMELIVF